MFKTPQVVIGKTVRPASLFAFAFFKEAATIREPMLDSVDRLLEDPVLLALSAQTLARRSPGAAPAILKAVSLAHKRSEGVGGIPTALFFAAGSAYQHAGRLLERTCLP
jgi:hypothetical protein